MLRIFRHKGITRKVLWVVAGLIIVSFALSMGVSQYTGTFSLSQTAGKVFGKAVSLKEYQRNFQNAQDQAIMMHGSNASRFLAVMDMDNETWTRIILLKAAEARGIKAMDAEVVQYIASIPFFQRNGEFDKRLYAGMARNVFHREARDFEEGLRDQIKIMKLFAPHLQSITFTDEQVRTEYERRNQKMQVSYMLIAPEDFAKDIIVTEAELRTYYDTRSDELREPQTVNAVIITVPAAENDQEGAFALAQQAHDALTAGTDPAAAAKAVGATITETGFFDMNNPPAALTGSFELLQQIFMAGKGDVLPVQGTDKGLQVIKIIAQNPSFTPEFARIKDKVKSALVQEKAIAAASAKAAELQKTLADKIKTGADLAAAAKELGLTVKQTPFFGLGEYVPEIGLSDDFTAAAFKLSKDNRLSEAVLTARGPAILYWLATQPVDEQKFTETKEDFKGTLYAQERVRVMNEVIRSVREQAKLENYIEKIGNSQKNAMEKLRVK